LLRQAACNVTSGADPGKRRNGRGGGREWAVALFSAPEIDVESRVKAAQGTLS
jgi:hypothetical protein